MRHKRDTRTLVNGYPILKFQQVSMFGPWGVVMVHRPDNNFHPYVVWDYDMRNGNTVSGGYYATREEAEKDLENRLRRA